MPVIRKPLVLAALAVGLLETTRNGNGPTSLAQSAADFREIVLQAKEHVFPAVIYVKVVRETHDTGKKGSQEIAGSGVVISPKGQALTNWHVVDKALEVRCLLTDGRAFKAKVLGTDKDTDLALLQLTPADGKTAPLPFAKLGNSDKLVEGDFVMAMGAPWGLNRSVSIGIVSCPRRVLAGSSEYHLWLQTDASICPGNSGGPLVNTSGEIVGINTLGSFIGGDMGFAIPSNAIEFVAGQIRKSGKVAWSWTGLQLQALRDFNRDIYFDETEGVIVAGADPESPASRAGFQSRDRIVKVNGQPVTALTEEDLPAIRKQLGLLPLNLPARFEYVRGGKKLSADLTPREKGKVEGEEFDCPRWDFTVKAINQFDNPKLYFYRKQGVFVFGVKSPGNAQEAGLARHDILLKVDGQDVPTIEALKAVHKASVDALPSKQRVVLTILRNGLMRQAALDYTRDYERE